MMDRRELNKLLDSCLRRNYGRDPCKQCEMHFMYPQCKSFFKDVNRKYLEKRRKAAALLEKTIANIDAGGTDAYAEFLISEDGLTREDAYAYAREEYDWVIFNEKLESTRAEKRSGMET